MTISAIGGGFLPSSLGGASLGSLTTLALAVISAASVPLAAAASTAGSVMESAEQCKTACEKLKDGAVVCFAGCMAVGQKYYECSNSCDFLGNIVSGVREACMAVCLGAKPAITALGYVRRVLPW